MVPILDITLSGLIADVTSIFTAAIGWVSTVSSTIAGDPMLLMFVLIPVIFLGVNLFRRLLRV